MSPLHDRVMRALTALGPTADDVADRLLAGGWTGIREEGLACPVSNYIVAVIPDAEIAAVAFNRITVVSIHGETVETALPHGAARFVTAFDTGSYDDLAATITRTDGEVIDDLER